jgi:signal transduction histidine kinase
VVLDRTVRAEEERLLDRSRRLRGLRDLASRLSSRISELLADRGAREARARSPELAELFLRIEDLAASLEPFVGSTPEPSDWGPVDVGGILASLVGSGAQPGELTIGGGIRADVRVEPGLRPVRGSEASLRRALLEVLRNAVEAMPERGTLTVRAARTVLGEDPGLLAPGAYAEIVIEDTGPGMEQSQLEQAISPFYSTKPRDRFPGLGLATAYGILRSHGGDLRIDSEPGKGTRVRILFPESGTSGPPGVSGPSGVSRPAGGKEG